jgi:hypothetical protein
MVGFSTMGGLLKSNASGKSGRNDIVDALQRRREAPLGWPPFLFVKPIGKEHFLLISNGDLS